VIKLTELGSVVLPAAKIFRSFWLRKS